MVTMFGNFLTRLKLLLLWLLLLLRKLSSGFERVMGRGVSSGGGQSSLGYLFGSGEAPASKPASRNVVAAVDRPAPVSRVIAEKPSSVGDAPKQIPAGIQGSQKNNYHRADGQNTGNFLTDRPSTKVHSAPGGGSSLGYLFGGGSN